MPISRFISYGGNGFSKVYQLKSGVESKHKSGVNSRSKETDRIFDATRIITLAGIYFRYTPETTLNMGYSLLMNMFKEYEDLHNTEESKGDEIKINPGQTFSI